jgi:prepilin peptidase CpaA
VPSPDAIGIAIVAIGNGAAAIIDVRTRRVPNALTAGMAVAGFALAGIAGGRAGLVTALAGCLVGAVLMLPGHVLGGTGAGDVKLLAASGALLGPALTFRAFLATALAGGVLAVLVAIRRRRLTRTILATRQLAAGSMPADEIKRPDAGNRFAYAPAIAAGVLATVTASVHWELVSGFWTLRLTP